MGKLLSEMTLEELWQLYPIILTEHQDCWKKWFIEEEQLLRSKLSGSYQISHIGSTSIDSIWAKPIVDILVEIPDGYDMDDTKEILIQCGYICMSQSYKRMSFNKGYTESGFAERVFHLHLRYNGDNDELYFRDYLKEHPDIAKEYEQLKLNLWHKYEFDRDGYTEAKGDFIQKYTTEAKLLYRDRYMTVPTEKIRSE